MSAPTIADRRPLPRTPPVNRRLALALVVATVLAAAGAIAAGWWAGARIAAEPAATVATRADIGPARLTVSDAWRAVEGTAGIAGLDQARTAVFATAPPSPARAVVTLAPATDATLLPPALRAAVTGPPPATEPTTLLGLAAWRYAELPAAGGRRAEVTVVPTTAGVLTIACVAPKPAWSSALGCTSGVRALSVDGARWLPPNAQMAAADRLAPVLERLDRERLAARHALASASTRGGQSRAATRLRDAYRVAAATLRPAASTTGPSAQLVDGLQQTERAYEGLARAASGGRARRYAGARRKIAAAEQLVRLRAAALSAAVSGR